MLSDEVIHAIYQRAPNASHLDFAREIEKLIYIGIADSLVSSVEKIEASTLKQPEQADVTEFLQEIDNLS